MRSKVYFALFAVLLLVFAACNPAEENAEETQETEQPAEQVENTEVAEINQLDILPGTWVTEYEWPEYGKMREEITYTLNAENENQLDFTMKIFANDKEVDQGSGYLKRDPETNLVHQYSKSEATGSIYEGVEFQRAGNEIWVEGTSNDESMPKYRVKIVYIDDNSHTFTMLVPDEESEWKEMMSVTYNRVIE